MSSQEKKVSFVLCNPSFQALDFLKKTIDEKIYSKLELTFVEESFISKSCYINYWIEYNSFGLDFHDEDIISALQPWPSDSIRMKKSYSLLKGSKCCTLTIILFPILASRAGLLFNKELFNE
jgi:hypothetical protein